MTDHTVPEIEAYIVHLRELRRELISRCEGLPSEALNWKPPAPDTNSAYVLATHTAGSEAWWLHEIVGGINVHRDRPSEFVARADDIASLKRRMEGVAQKSELVLRSLSEADLSLSRTANNVVHDTRWCILHVIEHTSRHVGHIELTRQLFESSGANVGA